MRVFFLAIIAWLSSFGRSALPVSTPTPIPEIKYQIVEVARGLFVPWSIVFTGEDRILFTERNGRIREIKNGQLNPKALLTFTDVKAFGEAGLMGMAADESHYLYVCMTHLNGKNPVNRVQRLKDEGDKITEDKILLDDIPAAQYHDGCRVKFGPDGKLYITTGDSTNSKLAQDSKSLAGKILRMNSDGSDLEVFSLGHRNPQGIAWDAALRMWETEHGPTSPLDGLPGGDEVNIIQQGQNYGWPVISHRETKPGLISPRLEFTPAIAPAGADFLGKYFYFAALKGEAIYKVDADFNYIKLPNINFGRIREIVAGSDGALYFSTSNRDGRGTIRDGDDKIYKIIGLE